MPPIAEVTDQEFALSAADFERVRKLIYQRAGISLHAGKQAMVYSRLSRRLRDDRPPQLCRLPPMRWSAPAVRPPTPSGRSS